ncbi:MAG: hypothetical protein ABSE69_10445 [Roseiarcus sp.]|jgi:hypothetical protein
MSIDWLDVLKISASSSVLTASIGWGLDHVFVHRATLKKDARYLAQRVAIILEKFAVHCGNSITDNELHDRSEGHAGERHLTLPAIGPFPAEADWKAIDTDLMDRALSMPNELALADQAILFWWNVVGDEECMQTEANNRAGECGLRAWLLASELRRRCGIPASTLPATSWDFVNTLRRQVEAAEAQRRKKQDNEGNESPILATEGPN